MEKKFRAWDKSTGKMILDPTVNGIGHVNYIFQDGPDQDYMWEQFTGLHDSKGVEIYEGDVVEVQNLPCQIQKARLIGVVTMSWSAWGVDVKEIVVWRGYTPGVLPSARLFFMNIIDVMDYRIIGNIHENPELLKEG